MNKYFYLKIIIPSLHPIYTQKKKFMDERETLNSFHTFFYISKSKLY